MAGCCNQYQLGSQEVPQTLLKKSLESSTLSGEGVLDGQSVDGQSRGETGCCSPEEAWGRWGWKALTNPLEGLGLCLLGHGSNPKFGRRTVTHKVRCTDYPLGVCMDRTFPSWSSLYPMGADQGMLRQSVFSGSRCRVISNWFGQHLVPRLVWNRFFTCRWFLYQATFCVF